MTSGGARLRSLRSVFPLHQRQINSISTNDQQPQTHLMSLISFKIPYNLHITSIPHFRASLVNVSIGSRNNRGCVRLERPYALACRMLLTSSQLSAVTQNVPPRSRAASTPSNVPPARFAWSCEVESVSLYEHRICCGKGHGQCDGFETHESVRGHKYCVHCAASTLASNQLASPD